MGASATYITWVEDSGIFPANLGEGITLVAEKTVHVPDEAQVLFVAAGIANGYPPFLNCLENLGLDPRGPDGRALGEPADELIEELLCADLEVEGVATVLDADVEQVEGEEGDIGVAVVDVADNGGGGLARGGALLAVDEVGDLEAQGEVGLVVLGAAGRLDEAVELRGRAGAEVPAVAGRSSSR